MLIVDTSIDFVDQELVLKLKLEMSICYRFPVAENP